MTWNTLPPIQCNKASEKFVSFFDDTHTLKQTKIASFE